MVVSLLMTASLLPLPIEATYIRRDVATLSQVSPFNFCAGDPVKNKNAQKIDTISLDFVHILYLKSVATPLMAATHTGWPIKVSHCA